MNEELLSLIKRLERHPHLIARLRTLLDVTENTSGKVELARDAENMIFEEITKMGNEVLTAWGISQEKEKRRNYEVKKDAVKHGKKKYIG